MLRRHRARLLIGSEYAVALGLARRSARCASTTTRSSGASRRSRASSRASRRRSSCTATVRSGEGEDVTYTPPTTTSFRTARCSPAPGRCTTTRFDWTTSSSSPPSRRWPRRATTAAGRSRARRSTSRCARPGGRSPTCSSRAYRPVRFVASTRAPRLAPYRELYPELEFKLDVEEDWDRELMRAPRRDRPRARPRPEGVLPRHGGRSRARSRALPRSSPSASRTSVIEDAWLEDGCLEALAGAEDRLSFDAPIHSWPTSASLRSTPQLAQHQAVALRDGAAGCSTCIEQCEARGIPMYGGGQFELGPGRRQIQRLARVFYAGRPERRRAVRVQRGPGAARASAEPAAAARRGWFLINLFDDEPRRFGEALGADALGRHALRARTGRRVSVSLAVRRRGMAARRRRTTDAAHARRASECSAVGRRRVRARRGGCAPVAQRHRRACANRLLLDVLGSGGGRVSGQRRSSASSPTGAAPTAIPCAGRCRTEGRGASNLRDVRGRADVRRARLRASPRVRRARRSAPS